MIVAMLLIVMPRAVCGHSIIFVSPGYNAAYSVLTSSMGEPTVEPLVSDKAAVVTNLPKGAVFG